MTISRAMVPTQNAESYPRKLSIQPTADPREDQARMEGVLEEPVKHFGFREELVFPWQPAA